jgi:HEXXH motif-containing protein
VTLPVHRLEPGLLDALAAGGGAPAVRWLAGVRRSRTMILVRAVRDLAAAAGHPQAALARDGYAALARVHRVAPAAAEALLAAPGVGAWAASTAAALAGSAPAADAGGVAPGRLAVVAAAAALRGGVPLVLALPTDGHAPLRLPGLGTAVLPEHAELEFWSDGERAELRGGRHAVRLPRQLRQPAPDWRPVPRVETAHRGSTLQVTLDSLDGDGCGELPVSWWQHRLAAGWRLLVRHHARVAAEVAAGIRMVAPLAAGADVLHSITYRDAFGCVAMTPPPSARWVALTFAHEVQHAKLSVLTDVAALTQPDREALFYAPWRSDTRPVAGLLHGLYAHLGVAGFWRRQRRHEPPGKVRFRAEVEYVRWREACEVAAATLRASQLLTPAGARFVAAQERILRRWAADTVPAAAAATARAEADRHRASALSRSAVPAREKRESQPGNSPLANAY